MTKDDVIEWAREAGFVEYELDDGTINAFDMRYAKFAKLVAEHEREEIAQFIERTNLGSLPNETAVHYALLLKSYATAIRARGEA